MNALVQLGDALSEAPLFTDGDWVESKDQDPHGDVRLVQLADIGAGRFLDKSARFLTTDKAAELRCTFLEPGDVLVARMPDPIGRACIFPGAERPSVTVVDVCVIRCDARTIEPRYLMHALNSIAVRSQIENLATGSTRSRVSRGNLAKVGIHLPSLSEQRRIATILDHADALRAKRRQVLAHFDALNQSIFHDMFGATTWTVEKLADRLEFLTSGSRGWAKYYAPAGAKFIRIQNVKNGYLDDRDMAYVTAPQTAEAKRTAVRPGDVLLSITADLGRTAVVPDDIGAGYINQHLAILRAPSLVPRYLADFLESPVGRREVLGKDRGATKAGLNFDDVRSVSIPVPPRDVQHSYAARIERINAQRAAAQRAIDAEDELFASLQSRAFRAEL